MRFCWLCPPRNADKARRRDPLSSQGLCTWAEIHQNICEVDLWLIEGLISSPLVFIRGGMGGRQGGSLSVFGAPAHSDWLRAEWSQRSYSSELESPACCIQYCIIRHPPDSWKFTVVCCVSIFFFFTVLQLFIYLVKHRSGLHLAVKCLMGGEVRFYKLVETSGFVAKEQREAKRRHNSKTNQQTNKKKWFIQTSDSCTIPKTLFAGPFFKSNNWSIDSWQNILRDTSALTDKIQKCYNKVIISPVKGFFLFFFPHKHLDFFTYRMNGKFPIWNTHFHVRDTFISFLSPQCGNAEPDNQTMAGELCIPYEFHILAYFPLIQSFCIWTGHFHKSVTVLHMNKKSPNWRFHMWITYSVFICDCDSHTWKFYSTRHYQQDSILCQCLPKPFKVYAAE